MTYPTNLPPTSGPAAPSAVMSAINDWLLAFKANWAGEDAPPDPIDGLIHYYNPAGFAPRLRYRRSAAWAGILDDVGREATNLNNAVEGGLRYFGIDTLNAPFPTAGSVLVLPRPTSSGGGITQIASRQGSEEANLAFVRIATSVAGGSGVWTPWRRMYTQADIVGTVARSGGVPSGAIIESGVLSSGHYCRLTDGTQWCHATRTLTRDDTTRLHNLWTFPRAFNGSDYRVSFTLRSIIAAPTRAMLSATSVGDTSSDAQLRILQYRIQGQTDFASGDTAQMDVTVFGRWASP